MQDGSHRDAVAEVCAALGIETGWRARAAAGGEAPPRPQAGAATSPSASGSPRSPRSPGSPLDVRKEHVFAQRRRCAAKPLACAISRVLICCRVAGAGLGGMARADGRPRQRRGRAARAARPGTNLANICDGGFWALDNSRPKVKRQCVDGSNSPVAPSRCVHGQPCRSCVQKARLQHRHPDEGGLLPLVLYLQ